MLSGNLKNGGLITNDPSKLVISFACQQFKQSTTDLQLHLDFGNNKDIELFLSKECDSVQAIQEYFTVLSVIYWIIIILIVLLIVAVAMHYYQNQNISFQDLLSNGKRYTYIVFDWLTEKYYEYRYPGHEKRHFVQLDKFVEPENLDIQITSSNEERIKDKNDYGGL
jgi:hypothetical protein